MKVQDCRAPREIAERSVYIVHVNNLRGIKLQNLVNPKSVYRVSNCGNHLTEGYNVTVLSSTIYQTNKTLPRLALAMTE